MIKLEKIEELEQIISKPRFSVYLKHSDDDRQFAYELYLYNLEVSSILYYNIHWVEITLRNAINQKLIIRHGQQWYQADFIVEREKEALDSLLKWQKNGKLLSHDDIVAKLNFGFWCGLFKPRYSELWRHDLKQIFQSEGALLSKDIAKRLRDIRHIRNRVAHYEPIFKSDLQKTQQNIIEILCMLETNTIDCLKQLPVLPCSSG